MTIQNRVVQRVVHSTQCILLYKVSSVHAVQCNAVNALMLLKKEIFIYNHINHDSNNNNHNHNNIMISLINSTGCLKHIGCIQKEN